VILTGLVGPKNSTKSALRWMKGMPAMLAARTTAETTSTVLRRRTTTSLQARMARSTRRSLGDRGRSSAGRARGFTFHMDRTAGTNITDTRSEKQTPREVNMPKSRMVVR
jgi:hypothetical protein